VLVGGCGERSSVARSTRGIAAVALVGKPVVLVEPAADADSTDALYVVFRTTGPVGLASVAVNGYPADSQSGHIGTVGGKRVCYGATVLNDGRRSNAFPTSPGKQVLFSQYVNPRLTLRASVRLQRDERLDGPTHSNRALIRSLGCRPVPGTL
jgi:hypothetical protein